MDAVARRSRCCLTLRSPRREDESLVRGRLMSDVSLLRQRSDVQPVGFSAVLTLALWNV